MTSSCGQAARDNRSGDAAASSASASAATIIRQAPAHDSPERISPTNAPWSGMSRNFLDVRPLEPVEELAQPRLRQLVGDRIPAFRNDVLADHHLDPRARVEQLVEARGRPARTTRNRSILCCSGSGTFMARRSSQNGSPSPLIDVIVEDDEVADALHLERDCVR